MAGTTEILVGGGVAAILGAVAGGGLKAFGVDLPLLASTRRQLLLAFVGLLLLVLGLAAASEPAPAPPRPYAATLDRLAPALAQFQAQIDYGKYRSAQSYAGAVDRYVELDALLGALNEQLRSDLRAHPGDRLYKEGQSAVLGCREGLRQIAILHEREGIPRKSGLAMLKACVEVAYVLKDA